MSAVSLLKEGVVTSMKVTGIFMQYEVENDGTYYYGSGRNWMERMGESLEQVYDDSWDKDLIDKLEQAVKDYEQSTDKSNRTSRKVRLGTEDVC